MRNRWSQLQLRGTWRCRAGDLGGQVPPVPVACLTVPRRVRCAEEVTFQAASHQRVEAQCLNAWRGHGAVPASPASGPAFPGAHVATTCRWDRGLSLDSVPL